MQPDNKQKIFYKLTDCGKVIYRKHEKLHNYLTDKNNEFFSEFSKEIIKTVSSFMNEYNKYLENEINKLN